jgi:hypothetical protein
VKRVAAPIEPRVIPSGLDTAFRAGLPHHERAHDADQGTDERGPQSTSGLRRVLRLELVRHRLTANVPWMAPPAQRAPAEHASSGGGSSRVAALPQTG